MEKFWRVKTCGRLSQRSAPLSLSPFLSLSLCVCVCVCSQILIKQKTRWERLWHRQTRLFLCLSQSLLVLCLCFCSRHWVNTSDGVSFFFFSLPWLPPFLPPLPRLMTFTHLLRRASTHLSVTLCPSFSLSLSPSHCRQTHWELGDDV